MKLWKILLPLGIVATFFVTLTVKNVLNHNKNLKVFTIPEYNICYLVSAEYQLELFPNGFKYSAGKNHGTVNFGKGTLNPSLIPRSLGEFEGAYQKVRNVRIVQYKLSEDDIATEMFELVSKNSPANLQPHRKGCEQFAKIHESYEF